MMASTFATDEACSVIRDRIKRDELDRLDAGYCEYQLRQSMEDMRRFVGFDCLRAICAEILNEIADGRKQ